MDKMCIIIYYYSPRCLWNYDPGDIQEYKQQYILNALILYIQGTALL